MRASSGRVWLCQIYRDPSGSYPILPYIQESGNSLYSPAPKKERHSHPHPRDRDGTSRAQEVKYTFKLALTLPAAFAEGVLPSAIRLTTSPFGGRSRGQVSRSVLRDRPTGSRVPLGTV